MAANHSVNFHFHQIYLFSLFLGTILLIFILVLFKLPKLSYHKKESDMKIVSQKILNLVKNNEKLLYCKINNSIR